MRFFFHIIYIGCCIRCVAGSDGCACAAPVAIRCSDGCACAASVALRGSVCYGQGVRGPGIFPAGKGGRSRTGLVAWRLLSRERGSVWGMGVS